MLRGAPQALLDSYHAERHAAARENLAVTSATMDFLVPRTPADAAHRRAVLARAATDPLARAQVDSGRLAEPFWYVDSPLTTPSPRRPFAGRPPRGQASPAGPGVLLPDAPVRGGRIRALARDGFLLLAAPGVDPGAVAGHDARVLNLTDVDVIGALTAALDARPAEVWVVRPDAHVAAVLVRPGPAAVAAALRRAQGYPQVEEATRDGVLPAAR